MDPHPGSQELAQPLLERQEEAPRPPRSRPPPKRPYIIRSPSGDLILGGGDSRGRYSGLNFPPTPSGGSPMASEPAFIGLRCIRCILSRSEEALASGTDIERAAAIIDKAIEGPPIPMDVLASPDFHSSVRLFFTHERLSCLWGISLVALVLLLFFEVPPWCRETSKHPCGDPNEIPLGGLPYVTRFYAAIIQALATALLAFETYLVIGYSEPVCNSTQDPLVYIKVVLLTCLSIDCIALAYSGPDDILHLLGFHIAYYIRIPTVLVFSRSLRLTFLGILRMAWNIKDFIVLVVGFVAYCSWLAVRLFHNTEEGRIWFPNYQEAMLNMFALLTASSQPDMQIPAYLEWRASVFFFAIYLVLGLFFLMNLFLAVIFESYKQQVAKNLVEERSLQTENLYIAFELLDSKSQGWLDGDQIFALLRALHKNRIVRIRVKNPQSVCSSLQTDQNFQITKEEFPDLCHVLIRKFPRAEREEHWVELLCPDLFHTEAFQAFVAFTCGRHLTLVTNFVLVLNAFFLLVEGQYFLADNQQGRSPWFNALVAFGWLYIVEALLKLAGRGPQKFWVGYRSRFDFCIALSIAAVFVLSPFSQHTGVSIEWLWFLESVRLVRLASVLSFFRRYKVVARTFLGLIPSLSPLIACLFCTLCLFNAIGVQLFGGLIYDDNPKLQGTDYLNYHYTTRNFNDFGSGMVTLFDLCIMSNWVTYMKAFVAVTGSTWVRAYFITFYFVAVLFLLNLVVAFVLQGFLTQMKEEEIRQSRPPSPREVHADIDVISRHSSVHGIPESPSFADLAHLSQEAHGATPHPHHSGFSSFSPPHLPQPHHRNQREVRLMESLLKTEMKELEKIKEEARAQSSLPTPMPRTWSVGGLHCPSPPAQASSGDGASV